MFASLTLLGVAGYHLRYPIFFGLDFVFGSIFPLLALQLIGAPAGIASALLSSLYTYVLWNHPYAVATFTIEVAAVAWLYRRCGTDFVLADAVFWGIVGIPLTLALYGGVMGLPFDIAFVTVLKQAVNGVANALVARTLYMLVSWRLQRDGFSMREAFFNCCIAFVLLPALYLLIAQGRKEEADIEGHMRENLMATAARARLNLDSYLRTHLDLVELIARLASSATVPQVQSALEAARVVDADLLRIGLLDDRAITVAYAPLQDELGRSTLGIDFSDRPFIPRLKEGKRPFPGEVVMGRIGPPIPMLPLVAPVLVHGRYAGYVSGILNLDRLGDLLALNTRSADLPGLTYTVLDLNGRVIISSRPELAVMDGWQRPGGELVPLSGGLEKWLPDLPANVSVVERRAGTVYVMETQPQVADWRLVLEAPVKPFQASMNAAYAALLVKLCAILGIALLAARALSGWAGASFGQLRQASADLPLRISANETLTWPNSRIAEVQRLIENFREVADELKRRFEDSRRFSTDLERQVKLRTAELVAQSVRLQTLLDTATDGIHVLDDQGNLVQYSTSFLRMLGYSPGEATALRMADWDQSVPADRIAAALGAVPATPQLYETRQRRKDGTVFDVEVNARRITLDGRTFIYASARDVTERKRAMAVLEESEQRFRTLANTAPVMVWMSDATLRRTWFNATWLAFTGRTLEEELACDPMRDVHPEDAPVCAAACASATAGRQRFETEYRMRRHDGEYRWVLETCVPRYDAAGTFEGCLGTCMDITERRQLVAELQLSQATLEERVADRTAELKRAAEALTRSNIELQRFAYVASHDLQTPLRAIASFSQLVEQAVRGRTEPRVEDWLRRVLESARHMQRMINDLLAYARVDSRSRPFSLVGLAVPCSQAIDMLSPEIDAAGAAVTVGQLPVVHGDEVQLVQLFQNLVSNALRYRGSAPPVVRISAERHAHEHVVAVEDNGCGIAPGDRERVFEIFFRAHAARSTPGTGVGLAVCRAIVRHHGGRIWVDAAPGGGSIFRFTLPVEVP